MELQLEKNANYRENQNYFLIRYEILSEVYITY